MKVEIIDEGESHVFAGTKNVLLSLYWDTADADALLRRLPWFERTSRRYEQFGLLVVIDSRVQGVLPDRRFRVVSKEQAERFKGKLTFSAVVIEGQGVRQTLIRTFLRTLQMVAGQNMQVRFFDSVYDASRWVAELVTSETGLRPQDLVDAVEGLRPSEVESIFPEGSASSFPSRPAPSSDGDDEKP